MDLVLVAAAVMVLGVAMYVILDGFDLGIGILFPFAPDETARDTMIASIAPLWDGNETWLVLGGVMLFAVFPLAYSVILPALYLGIMLFLAALVFRGMVFEFRPKARRKWIWNASFAAGSTLAAFAQGVVLGNMVEGFELADGRYVGGPFGWFSPFTFMTGVALVCGYALLGACWLIVKTSGAVQAWSFRVARPLGLGLVGFIALVSVWTPLAQTEIAERWFSWPNILYLSPFPLVTGIVALRLFSALNHRREKSPFLLSVTLFLLAFGGLGVSLWPYVVPRHYTLWEAAAPRDSLVFVLTGVLILLPLVLGYTVHSYRVFRGKVRPEGGYH